MRIGKRILDDWNKDTCVGKYIKTIYKQRISKNKKSYNTQSASQYSTKYGGQFHFDIKGLGKKRILAMDGFGGQQIIVDFDLGRIIVINSLDRHYNWKKIVHKKIKTKVVTLANAPITFQIIHQTFIKMFIKFFFVQIKKGQ